MVHRDVLVNSSGVTTTAATTTIDNGAASVVSTTTSIADPTNEAVQCGVCSKTFSKAHQLNAHMAVHDKTRPLACEYCTYRFSTTAKLNAHVKLHMETGETVLQTVDAEQTDDDPNDDKIQDIAME